MMPNFTRLLIAALFAACAPATAQGWKSDQRVEIVVATTPGGGSDRTARTLQKILQEGGLINVPVTVVNKAGGGGAVQLTYLNQHAGDGHYIAINSPNLIGNDISGRSPVKYTDVTPLANLFSEYMVISVRADSPLKVGQDFIDRLRKDPASLAVSTGAALGSFNHLSFALVANAAGVNVKKLKVVTMGSSGEGVTALLGGHIDAAAGTPSSVVAMVRAGKVRALGILAPKRIGGPYAGTPTWAEQGYPTAARYLRQWRGVVGPKGMTPEQITFWEGVLEKAVGTELWKQMLEQNIWEPDYLNSAQTRGLFDDDYATYRATLRDLGMVK